MISLLVSFLKLLVVTELLMELSQTMDLLMVMVRNRLMLIVFVSGMMRNQLIVMVSVAEILTMMMVTTAASQLLLHVINCESAEYRLHCHPKVHDSSYMFGYASEKFVVATQNISIKRKRIIILVHFLLLLLLRCIAMQLILSLHLFVGL